MRQPKMRKIYQHPVVQIIKVSDGDTCDVLLDLGYESYRKITTRLLGLDCPEKNTDAGKLVREVALKWLNRVVSVKNRLEWRSIDLDADMYNRSLGVFLDMEHPDETLNRVLLTNGMAKPYSGIERREEWTAEELGRASESARRMLE